MNLERVEMGVMEGCCESMVFWYRSDVGTREECSRHRTDRNDLGLGDLITSVRIERLWQKSCMDGCSRFQVREADRQGKWQP